MIRHFESYLAASISQASLLNPEGFLREFGPYAFGIALLVLVVECGVIFGGVLPGNSLLFVVGVLLASGFIALPVPIALLLMVLAAFCGNVIGYWTGVVIGPRLFNRPDSKIFKQEFVETTHLFFEKFGPKAIVLARFVPVVRSIITCTAGIGKMAQPKFLLFSFIGSVVWVLPLTLTGYFLGNIELVKQNLEAVTLALIVVTSIPILMEMLKQRANLRSERDPQIDLGE